MLNQTQKAVARSLNLDPATFHARRGDIPLEYAARAVAAAEDDGEDADLTVEDYVDEAVDHLNARADLGDADPEARLRLIKAARALMRALELSENPDNEVASTQAAHRVRFAK
jgi:hypothetical protein